MKKRDSNILKYFFNEVFNLGMKKKEIDAIPIDEKEKIDKLINDKYTISFGIVGSKGAGKSTTLSCLFGFEDAELDTDKVEFYEKDLGEGKGKIIFYDFPGFGDLLSRKDFIQSEYDKYLPMCDVILWVFEARKKVIELDEIYIHNLSEDLKSRIVIGLSQVDLTPPNWEWNKKLRTPSVKQMEFINDRKNKLSQAFDIEIDRFVEYSALYNPEYNARFNVIKLVRKLVSACSEQKFILGEAFVKDTMETLNSAGKEYAEKTNH